MKATILLNTFCFFVMYLGFSGLILGSISLRSVPFPLAYPRFSEYSQGLSPAI